MNKNWFNRKYTWKGGKEEKKNHAKWNKNDSADIITFDIHNK